jgi:hypothetical protein
VINCSQQEEEGREKRKKLEKMNPPKLIRRLKRSIFIVKQKTENS